VVSDLSAREGPSKRGPPGGKGPSKKDLVPLGWHPPMELPSKLKKRCTPEEYSSLLARELKAYESAGLVPYGVINRLKTHPEDGDSDWETESSGFSSLTSSPGSLRPTEDEALESLKDVKPDFTGSPRGRAWFFEPFPLSKKEERFLIKRRHWRNIGEIQFGDYSVAPSRYDLKWIQRIFWAAREIRSLVRTISLPSALFIKDLLKVRNLLYSLSPGNGKKSKLLNKLTSDVYYCLRQCNRLQDERENSTRVPACCNNS
jgi:hypothetical protein